MLPDLRFRITAQGATAPAFAQVRNDVARTNGLLARARVEAIGLGAAFRGLGGIVGGVFAGREFVQLLDASTRIQNSLKVAGLSGEELTRVYDRLFQSAQRNAAPIEALVDLYGRAALVQKELGISSEELLGFTDKVAVALRVSGKSAQESSGALLQLSQALGSGIVRAEEFNSILEGALPIAQAAAAGLQEAGGSVAKLRQLVVDGKVSSEAFFRAFEAGSSILTDKVAGAELTVSQGFVRLQNVLTDAAGRFNDVTGASHGAGAALSFLAGVIKVITDESSPFMQALDGYTTSMSNLGDSFNRLVNDPSFDNLYDFLFVGSADTPAQRRIQAVAAATEALRDRLREVNAERQPGGTVIPMTSSLAGRFDDAFSARKTITLADYAVGGGAGNNDAKNAADKAAKVREELAFEAEQLTRTAREQEIYNRLKAAGVDINSAEGREIAEATGKLYDQQRAITRLNDAVESVGGEAYDAFAQFVEGSKSAEDAIKDLIKQLLLAEARALFLNAITGGRSDLGPIASLIGGARANGGPVSPGKAYLVGEKGPELMVPGTHGNIIPNSAIRGGGVNVTLVVNNNIRGNADADVVGSMGDKLRRVVQAELPQAIRKARANREI